MKQNAKTSANETTSQTQECARNAFRSFQLGQGGKPIATEHAKVELINGKNNNYAKPNNHDESQGLQT
jgi:hypothetical protein